MLRSGGGGLYLLVVGVGKVEQNAVSEQTGCGSLVQVTSVF